MIVIVLVMTTGSATMSELGPTAGLEREIVTLMPALRRFARTFERSPSDVEDLVQDAVVKALGNLHQFHEGSSMKSWLFTIIRNVYCSKYKINKRFVLCGDVEMVTDRQLMPSTQEWTLRASEVAKAISDLDAPKQQVLMMVIDGVSYENIAEACGCELGTIKSRIARARSSLMVSLGETTFSNAVTTA
jgi:RNA polymerase sigma-70 factor (ECF subfamily)